MADHGLFVGWGSSRAGRERASAPLFAEAVAYWDGLKAAGEIEDVQVVILGPHGGDLAGFALLEGSLEQLARVRRSPEFRRLHMRAGVCLDSVGIVDATVNDGVMASMQQWSEAIADLV